ncbi:MAG: SagB/ThcOx family dehydrogenase [Anaerolineae bacterium]|nr:SagB/ThcOx family dehydrogenase [Anaerolineae bacterium]
MFSCAPGPLRDQSPLRPHTAAEAEPTPLPPPDTASGLPLTQTLARRRSLRQYSARELTDEEVGQLLWAAQGITDDRGFRTAPSAGATYPLELYLATRRGLFHYRPAGHQLARLQERDLRGDLAAAGLNQTCIRDAPAVFVVAAVYGRTSPRYGARAERYVHLEAGHACQNLLLQAEALGLGGVPVGAFEDERVARLLGLPSGETPLYLVPVGQPA